MYQKCTNRECTYVCIPSAAMAAFGQSVIDTYTHVTDVYTSVISAHARAGAHLSARTQRCMYMCLQMQVYMYTCMHTPTVRARQAQQARCCASSAKRRAALGRWACSVEQAVVRTRLGVHVYGMCTCMCMSMSMGVAMGVWMSLCICMCTCLLIISTPFPPSAPNFLAMIRGVSSSAALYHGPGTAHTQHRSQISHLGLQVP